MNRSLLIFGGNGFVGSAVAKWALTQGVNVTCVSRSAKPRVQESWQTQVKYVKGNVLEPASYASLLPTVDAVIHSVGVLFDSRTPLNIFNTYEGSYEQMNRDSALILAGELKALKKPLVYVSAERGMFFSPRYLSTKREVEQFLKSQSEVPYAIVRPGFMYREEEKALRTVACVLDTLHAQDQIYHKLGLDWVAKTIVPSKTLDVNVVGKAIVLAALKAEFHGKTLDVEDIESLAKNYAGI